MNVRFDFYTPSEISKILGERLKSQRLLLRLTQATLAERSGIGVSTVARIESGQGGTLDNIIRLALALGIVNHFAELFDVAPINIEDVIAKQNLRLRASNKSLYKATTSMYQRISIVNIYYQGLDKVQKHL